MSVIYLDNNATSAVAPEVLEALLPFYQNRYGNPSSMHDFGGEVAHDVVRARAQVAALFHSRETEVLFTSCGTESDNAAIRGVLEAYPDKRHIITTRVEHPAVLNLCKHLENRGYHITYLAVDGQGRLDLDALRAALTPDTAIVSVMTANNETGVVFPIRKIGEIVKEHGVVFHTDAVQAAGKLSLDMNEIPADLVSVSGHKLHAPKGVGALYIRRGTRFVPFMIGGHQEHGRRGGTENVAGIVGLGRAAELAQAHFETENKQVAALRDKLEAGILAKVSHTRVNGDREFRLPNTTNISFEYIEGEAILLKLNEQGICASSGSACTSGSLEPSHVLRAMGVPFTSIHGSIRFSLSRYTTEAEVNRVLEVLPNLIAGL
ncbi:MAG: cysteine desulfurase NifS, partial [Candidatus Firestonebacteria bacterium]|nr:cysteine desulfurase NifS [Candidatus Firestonebacteria bacterium]